MRKYSLTVKLTQADLDALQAFRNGRSTAQTIIAAVQMLPHATPGAVVSSSLDVVARWVADNHHAIAGYAGSRPGPDGKWSGVLMAGGRLGLRSVVVRDLLYYAGMDDNAVIRGWVEDGIIDAEKGRNTLSVRIPGAASSASPQKMIVFRHGSPVESIGRQP